MLEMQNFGTLGTFGKPTPEEQVTYFQEYTSRNTRIQKAQFHVAFSCKGHEMTEAELLDFAHRYLSEMGYGEEGQPLLTRVRDKNFMIFNQAKDNIEYWAAFQGRLIYLYSLVLLIPEDKLPV